MHKHTVNAVYRGSPETIKKLRDHLLQTYNGSLPKGEAMSLATVMAMSLTGHVSGFWGGIDWEHKAGQFEDGSIHYSW